MGFWCARKGSPRMWNKTGWIFFYGGFFGTVEGCVKDIGKPPFNMCLRFRLNPSVSLMTWPVRQREVANRVFCIKHACFETFLLEIRNEDNSRRKNSILVDELLRY